MNKNKEDIKIIENSDILETEKHKKLPLDFYLIMPEPMKKHFSEIKNDVLYKFHEDTLIYFLSKNYAKICSEICPIIIQVLKFYNAKNEEYAFYLEILAKSLFENNENLLPNDALEIKKCLLKFVKIKKIRANFELNWQSVLKILELFYSEQMRGNFHINSEIKENLLSEIPFIIRRLKKYFHINSGVEIYNYLKQFIGPPHNISHSVRYIIYMHLLIRTDFGVKIEHFESWLKDLIGIWEIYKSSEIFTGVVQILIGELAKSHIEFDWQPYYEKIIPNLTCWITGNSFKKEYEEDNEIFLIYFKPSLIQVAEAMCSSFLCSQIKVNNFEKSLSILKNEIVPYYKTLLTVNFDRENMSKNILKFVNSFFLNICSRIKSGKKTDLIWENQKLLNDIYDIFSDIFDIFINYYQRELTNYSTNFCTYCANICPSKFFNHIIPKLLKILENEESDHDLVLKIMLNFITQMMLNSNFNQKYAYIEQILKTMISEIKYSPHSSSILAIKIITNILAFLPISNKNQLKQDFKGDYKNYLEELKKNNENSYFYHTLINSLEEKIMKIMKNILEYCENRDLPDKDDENLFSASIENFVLNVFPNISKEIINMLFVEFNKFLVTRIHLNCKAEIQVILSGFIKRIPNEVFGSIFEYSHKEILRKIDKSYEKPKYFELFSSKCDFMLNPYIQVEHLEYFVEILYTLITNFPNEISETYTQSIEQIIILLMLNEDKKKRKNYKIMYKAILFNFTKIWNIQISREMQEIFINSENLISKFNEKLNSQWIFPTASKLENAKNILTKFCIKFGESLLENKATDSNLLKKWLKIIFISFSACSDFINNSENILKIDNILYYKNSELSGFYTKILKAKIYEILYKITKNNETLKNSSTKILSKIFKTSTQIINISKYAQNIELFIRTKLESMDYNQKYKSFIKQEHGLKYFYYIQKGLQYYYEICDYCQLKSNYMDSNLNLFIFEINDLIKINPSILEPEITGNFINIVTKIQKNFPEFIFKICEYFSESVYNIIKEISDQKFSNNNSQKLLDYYTEFIKSLTINCESIKYNPEFLYEKLLKNYIFSACNTDNDFLMDSAFKILSVFEQILQSTFKFKPLKIASPQLPNTKFSIEMPKNIENLEKFKLEYENLIKIRENTVKTLLDEIIEISNTPGINIKHKSIITCLLSFISWNFSNNETELLKITNVMCEYLLDTNDIIRGLALSRIIEIIALRQHLIIKPIYSSYKDIQISELNKEKIYLDKLNYGFIKNSLLYARTYKNSEIKPELLKNDKLYNMISNHAEFMKIYEKFLKETEQTEIQDIENEIEQEKPPSPWIRNLMIIFEPHYIIGNSQFNPMHAGFYQSCFEYYGIIPEFSQILKLDIKNYFPLLEIVSGFLRASKIFHFINNPLIKVGINNCFEIMLNYYNKIPEDKFKGYIDSIEFFMKNRDPTRFDEKIMQFCETLISKFITISKPNFMLLISLIIKFYGLRIPKITEKILDLLENPEFIDWNHENIYFATDFSLIFAQILFQTCNCPINYDNECFHIKKSKQIIANLLKISSTNNTIKHVLLQILFNSINICKTQINPQSWIFGELIKPIYKFAIDDEDQNIKNSSLSVLSTLVTTTYINFDDFLSIFRNYPELIMNANWRFRHVAVCDLLCLIRVNNAFYKNIREFFEMIIFPLLNDPMIETSKSVANGLSHVWLYYDNAKINTFIEDYINKIKNNKIDQNSPLIYGSVFALISIINSYSMFLPPWLPNVLIEISKYKTKNTLISQQIRECISKFLESHKKLWFYEKNLFSAEQLDTIQNIIPEFNYFS